MPKLDLVEVTGLKTATICVLGLKLEFKEGERIRVPSEWVLRFTEQGLIQSDDAD